MIALLHLFIVAVIAGLVHIASLVAIPRTLADDAFSRLERLAEGGVTILSPEAMRALPFTDPATVVAVCRYDLAAGPLRVRTGLSDTFLVVVFAAEGRGIFASVSDRAATGGALDVVLALPAQRTRIEALDDPDEAVEEIRVTAAHPQGVALLKVFVDRPSGRDAAVDILRGARCENEALPES